MNALNARIVLPFLVLDGLAFFLTICFSDNQKGLFTFRNSFNIAIIVTFVVFAILGVGQSIRTASQLAGAKRFFAAIVQSVLTFLALAIVGMLI